MALIQASFLSASLMRTVRFNAVLPVDTLAPPPFSPTLPLKTLYLLHGYTGGSDYWLTEAALGEISTQHGLAIISLELDNDFFLDDPARNAYRSRLVGQELLEFTRKLLPLSDKREDTILGGFSMGGYGALRNGLLYGDNFGHIIAISSAIVTPDFFELQESLNLIGATHDYFDAVFGGLEGLAGSDKDLLSLPRTLSRVGKMVPDIYLAVGSNDMFAPLNRRFDALLTELNISHFYEEGAGTHDATIFIPYLKRGLERLDIDRPQVLPNPFYRDNTAGAEEGI
jgi:enterochelin esterase-like enzyme